MLGAHICMANMRGRCARLDTCACMVTRQRGCMRAHEKLGFMQSSRAGHGGAAVSSHCARNMPVHVRTALLRQLHSSSDSPTSMDCEVPAAQLSSCQQLQQQLPGRDVASTPAAISASAAAAAACLSPDAVQLALSRAFVDCDASIPEEPASEGGSTAVCALVGPHHVWVANCGKLPGCASQFIRSETC